MKNERATILGNLPGHEDAPPIAPGGRVWTGRDAWNGPIALGDLLSTSDTPARAMSVTDHAPTQGAILGKATTSLADGRGFGLVFATLQQGLVNEGGEL